MRFKEIQEQATSKLGFVISTVDGNFEDFDLVDRDTLMPTDDGHAKNLFAHTMGKLQMHSAFSEFATYFAKHVSGGVKLGQDYAAQDENDSFIMYPVDHQILGNLIEEFVDEYGLESDEPDEDSHTTYGVRPSDFY